MPRQPRDFVPGGVYHLISRFVDRDWYIASEVERARYVRLLGRAFKSSDWRCLSYGVMSNHVHLGVVAGEQPLDRWVRRVHAPFASWMNLRRDRIGVIFVRGPKAYRVRPDDVGDLIAYIHNNPVRAGVVTAAKESTWTSHRAYLGLAARPTWLCAAEGLELAGCPDSRTFGAWVELNPGDPSRFEPADPVETSPESEPEAIADVIPLASVPSPLPGVIVAETARELSMSTTELSAPRRGAMPQLARHIAVRCAMSLGVSGTEIASAIGITQQGVSVISRRGATEDVKALSDRVLRRLATGR